MDKVLSNFVCQHLNLNFKHVRLDDRSKRRNLGIHRKNVYLVKDLNKKHVLLHFSKKYRTIFDNYIYAGITLRDKIEAYNWKLDKENLLILLPYLGQSFSEPSKNCIIKITDLLTEINSATKFNKFKPIRYIDSIINYSNFTFVNLERTVSLLKKSGKKYRYGFGVLDPSFSNFTYRNRQTYLIDLDNFSDMINIDYELGFLSADINLQFKKKLNLSKIEKLTRKPVDKTMFYLGYISRLATIIIDFYSGENIANSQLDETIQTIDELSLNVLNTLE